MGKSKTKRQQQLVHDICDLTLLSLLESFMEGAPQLMLQLYIIQKIGTEDGLLMGNIITLHRHMLFMVFSLLLFSIKVTVSVNSSFFCICSNLQLQVCLYPALHNISILKTVSGYVLI